jgi:phage shock protein A
MANPFVKAWKYIMALFNAKIDEHADPLKSFRSTFGRR